MSTAIEERILARLEAMGHNFGPNRDAAAMAVHHELNRPLGLRRVRTLFHAARWLRVAIVRVLNPDNPPVAVCLKAIDWLLELCSDADESERPRLGDAAAVFDGAGVSFSIVTPAGRLEETNFGLILHGRQRAEFRSKKSLADFTGDILIPSRPRD